MLFCDMTEDGGSPPFTVDGVTVQDLILLMFSSMRVWI